MVLWASGASDQGVWCVYGCFFSRQFQWDHRRPCPTSAAGVIADLVKSCFGGLRGLWWGCVGCLWMHLFMAVPVTHRRHVCCRRPALSARTYVITWDSTHWPLHICGGKGGDKKLPCPLSAAADTAVFSRRRPYRPALMSSHETVLYTLTSICGGKGDDKKLPSAHGGGPLEPQWRHQNRLFSANVTLF